MNKDRVDDCDTMVLFMKLYIFCIFLTTTFSTWFRIKIRLLDGSFDFWSHLINVRCRNKGRMDDFDTMVLVIKLYGVSPLLLATNFCNMVLRQNKVERST